MAYETHFLFLFRKEYFKLEGTVTDPGITRLWAVWEISVVPSRDPVAGATFGEAAMEAGSLWLCSVARFSSAGMLNQGKD